MASKSIKLLENINSKLNKLITETPQYEADITFEKDGKNTRVEYSIDDNGITREISGSLKPYHTGRSLEYEFEPSWFDSDETSAWYDENWESVEDQIKEKI